MSAAALRVVFAGARGRMGRALLPGLRAAPDLDVVAEVDLDDDLAAALAAGHADVAVDFTTPQSAVPNARTILTAGAHAVIGTTGFTAADLTALDALARERGRCILVAPNFSLGMVLLQRCCRELAQHFPRAEVIETHHEAKHDAPSGTARHTAAEMAAAGAEPPSDPAAAAPSRGLDVDGVHVHSLRLPGIHARQEVHFASADEGLVLRHEAYSRGAYLGGVLAAVRAMPGRTGLVHGLDALLGG